MIGFRVFSAISAFVDIEEFLKQRQPLFCDNSDLHRLSLKSDSTNLVDPASSHMLVSKIKP